MSEPTPQKIPMKIQWDTVLASDMVRYWVKDYTGRGLVEGHEWYYDAAKQTFVLKLYVVESPATPTEETPDDE